MRLDASASASLGSSHGSRAGGSGDAGLPPAAAAEVDAPPSPGAVLSAAGAAVPVTLRAVLLLVMTCGGDVAKACEG